MASTAKFFSASIEWTNGEIKYSQLFLKVVRGANIKGATGSSVNPYVKVKLREPASFDKKYQEAQTEQKDSANPTWNFPVQFSLRDETSTVSDGIVFVVYDWDKIGDPIKLGKAVLPFSSVFQEHKGWQKDQIEILAKKSQRSMGSLVIETRIEPEILKYLGFLKQTPISKISQSAAEKLSSAFKYGPPVITGSDFPILIVTKFFSENCYNSTDPNFWKAASESLLLNSHPLKEPFFTTNQPGPENAKKILIEEYIKYWVIHIGDKNVKLPTPEELGGRLKKAIEFFDKNLYNSALYFATLPGLLQLPRAKEIFTEAYHKVFGESHEFLDASISEKLWAKLDGREPIVDGSATVRDSELFAKWMAAAQTELNNTTEISHLENVLNHINSAKAISNDPGLILFAAVLQPTDSEAENLIKLAASKGNSDASKLLAHLEKHKNWKELQRKCFEFEVVVSHVRDILLNTKSWDSFSYLNVL